MKIVCKKRNQCIGNVSYDSYMHTPGLGLGIGFGGGGLLDMTETERGRERERQWRYSN